MSYFLISLTSILEVKIQNVIVAKKTDVARLSDLVCFA